MEQYPESIDNLLVRILFIIEVIWWTGFAPSKFGFPFPGSLIPTFLADLIRKEFRLKTFWY
jgi:hypothetical protein